MGDRSVVATARERGLKMNALHALSLPFLHRGGDLGRLALRLVAGVVIAAHGWQKLVNGIDGFAGFVASLGLPAPMVVAYTVTGLELVGGLLLAAGLLTRIHGLLLAAHMAGTTMLVKADVGLIGPQDAPGVGAELDLVLLAAFAGVALLGPGAWSLDHAIGIEDEAYAPATVRGGLEATA